MQVISDSDKIKTISPTLVVLSHIVGIIVAVIVLMMSYNQMQEDYIMVLGLYCTQFLLTYYIYSKMTITELQQIEDDALKFSLTYAPFLAPVNLLLTVMVIGYICNI